MEKLAIHYPERTRAREYLLEWVDRTDCSNLSPLRDLQFLRCPRTVRISLDDAAILQPLVPGDAPARLVTNVRRDRGLSADGDLKLARVRLVCCLVLKLG